MKILIVEDERRLSDSLIQVLSDESYAADPAYDGVTAAELAEVNDYDLVVLDLNIPPPTGLDLLRAWRQAGSNVPILILTARDGVEDRVAGLDGGADDYLTTVTRTDLSEHVWDSSFDSMSNLVNVFVYRLRKKIDGDLEKKLIHTVPGHGYVLRSERS